MKLLKTAGIVLVLAAGMVLFMFFVLGMNPMEKSGYANCVTAQRAEAFVGRMLKFEGEAERETVRTEECARLDKELDKADGPKAGRVRWVECPTGPDCDEAGML